MGEKSDLNLLCQVDLVGFKTDDIIINSFVFTRLWKIE